MNRRLTPRLLALVALVLFAFPQMVLAADPPTVTETITDQVGTLSGGESHINAAAEKLKAERDIAMYVVWMNALDGTDPGAFVEQIATKSGLEDGRNVILLVSMGDRKDAVWASGSTSIDQSDLDNIRINQVEPQLKAGQFVGAVEAAASGFSAADLPAPVVTAAPPAPPPAPAEPINWAPLLYFFGVILAVVAIGSVVLFLFGWYNARRAARAEEEAAAKRMADLQTEARSTLIDGDDAVRDAEQDLAFAEAEFGPAEVVVLRTAIEQSKTLMQEAFQLSQEIDDEKPESYDKRMEMFDGIRSRTSTVSESLSVGTKHVDDLRALEERSAASIEKLSGESKQRTKAVEDARVVLARLEAHARSVFEAVEKNGDLAGKMYELADKRLDEAKGLLDKGERSKAALSLRSAEEAISKGQVAIADVEKLGRSLDEAERNLDAEMTSAEAEIANAENAIQTSKVQGFASNLRSAKQSITAARREVEREDADFILAYRSAVQSNVQADQVLDGIREEQERVQRAIAQAKTTIRTADASIAQADAYITRNRTKIGRKARTRLSEAQREYQNAVGQSDVFAAAAAAIAANQYAEEAYQVARNEVAEYDSPATSYGGYSGSSSSSRSSGSYSSGSSSSDDSWGSSGGISIGSFGGGSSGGSFGGGGGSSSGGGW